MSNINPISTSLRLTLSLGTVDGKKVEKSVTFGNISNDITPDKAKALVTAVADLFEKSLGVRELRHPGLSRRGRGPP